MLHLGHWFADFTFPGNLLGRLATPVTVILVLILAHTVANLTWNLWPEPISMPPPSQVAVTRPTMNRGPDTTVILNNNIFGKVNTERSSAVIATPISVPETQLKLSLRGIIAASPPDGGAIIAEQGGSDHFFRVGETISGGAVLQAVKPDQIIMLRNHRLETLSLPKESKLRGVNRPTPLPNKSISASEPEPEPETEPDTTDDAEANDEEEATPEEDPGQTLNYYRDQLFENPANLMNLVKTQPVYQNGRLQGFRLNPGQKGGALLTRYGLKSDDLVTSLNGIPLDNPMKAFEMLRNLRHAPTLEVGVSRQGRTENITLHFGR